MSEDLMNRMMALGIVDRLFDVARIHGSVVMIHLSSLDTADVNFHFEI